MKAIKNTSSFYVFSFARTLISTFFFNFVLLFSPFALRPSRPTFFSSARFARPRAHIHSPTRTHANTHLPPPNFFPFYPRATPIRLRRARSATSPRFSSFFPFYFIFHSLPLQHSPRLRRRRRRPTPGRRRRLSFANVVATNRLSMTIILIITTVVVRDLSAIKTNTYNAHTKR